MKRFAVVFVVLGLFFINAGTASAQMAQEEETYLRTPHLYHIFVDGGITVPATPSEFKSFWNTTLPFTVGVGAPVFSWMDLNGSVTFLNFGVNHVKAKQKIGMPGVNEVQGGEMSTLVFKGTARFLAVPNQRYNPFFEVGIGYFSSSIADLEVISPDNLILLTNEGSDAKGISLSIGGGMQYAMNEQWSSYVKYFWTTNKDGSFNPGDVIRAASDLLTESGSQQYSSISAGILIRL